MTFFRPYMHVATKYEKILKEHLNAKMLGSFRAKLH